MKKLLILFIAGMLLSGCNPKQESPAPITDNIPPVISLVGESIIYVDMWDDFSDIGSYASDNVDDRVEVVVTSNVDISLSGEYTIEYNATDSSGNKAETVYRTVYVQKNLPTITFSLTYITSDSIRISYNIHDSDNSIVKIKASIYEKGNPLAIQHQTLALFDWVEFYYLETGIEYEIITTLTYDLNNSLGEYDISLGSISTGVYTTIPEEFEELISNPDSYNTMKKLIYLPYTEYNVEEVKNIVLRLSHIDPILLEELVLREVEIILTNTKVTDIKEYMYLKGVTPRGWENTGKTWDDIPGIGGNPVGIKIGESDPGASHSSINLELHEVAHAINIYLLNGIANGTEFKSIQELEKNAMFGSNTYYEYAEEYFAECFAYYYLNEDSRSTLQDVAPLTYDFMSTLSERLE